MSRRQTSHASTHSRLSSTRHAALTHFSKSVADPLYAKRHDEDFHRFVTTITESGMFNGIVMSTIFLNALFMALETDDNLKTQWVDVLFVMDELFIAVYTLEFIMKVYAEPKKYWKSSYNVFDFLVLAVSYVQTVMSMFDAGDTGLEALRVFRALRTMRTLRTVSFIRGLQVLVTALLDTIRKWVINIIALLLLLMFLFAIMGYYFFGYKDDSDKNNWGSLSVALLTLFSFVTVDGWTELVRELDERGLVGGRAYSIGFILIGHFIFTNVFIGVIIMNISEATVNYKKELRTEREATLRQKKEVMMKRQQDEVRQMMERQKRGHFTNFQDMVREFQRTLRHDDIIMMQELSTNIIWMETLVRSLDHMDNTVYRVQQLHFEMANLLAKVMERKLRKTYGT